MVSCDEPRQGVRGCHPEHRRRPGEGPYDGWRFDEVNGSITAACSTEAYLPPHRESRKSYGPAYRLGAPQDDKTKWSVELRNAVRSHVGVARLCRLLHNSPVLADGSPARPQMARSARFPI